MYKKRQGGLFDLVSELTAEVLNWDESVNIKDSNSPIPPNTGNSGNTGNSDRIIDNDEQEKKLNLMVGTRHGADAPSFKFLYSLIGKEIRAEGIHGRLVQVFGPCWGWPHGRVTIHVYGEQMERFFGCEMVDFEAIEKMHDQNSPH